MVSAGNRPSDAAKSARISAAPAMRLATSHARATSAMPRPESRPARCRKLEPIRFTRSFTSSVVTISRRSRCSRSRPSPAASTAARGK